MSSISRKAFLKNVRRIVIKIGSAVLSAQDHKSLDDALIQNLVKQFSSLHYKNYEIIIVTSGAVAAGIQNLDLHDIPMDISYRQAAASVGQGKLIGKYIDLFEKENIHVGQILLTRDDLSDRQRYLNARTSLQILINLKVVPIINENDTVAVEEIKFGDNDTLTALIATLIDADLLLILSDVNGLYSGDPINDKKAKIIQCVEKVTKEIEAFAGTSKSALGKGGMVTKILAAKRCASSGIPTIIANGKSNNIITKIVKGENEGTLFIPTRDKLKAKDSFIANSLEVKGSLHVDNGANKAILNNKSSLLPAGVIKITGDFYRGDVVSCINEMNKEFARGIVNYNSLELLKIMGKNSSLIKELIGYKMGDEVIHESNLVILENCDDRKN